MEKVSVLNKIRNVIGRLMQRSELILKFLFKFVCFYLLFRMVNAAPVFEGLEEGLFSHNSIMLVLAFAAAILPNRAGVFIALLMIVYNVFQTSMIGAMLVGTALMLMYVAASSLFPDEVFLIALVPVCIHYHWYLAVPLVAGMYMGIVAVIPMVIGVITYGIFGVIPLFTGLQMGESLNEIPQLIKEASESGISEIMGNNSLVYLMVFSAAVVILTALLKKLHLNFSRYIAIGAGSLFGMVMLIIGTNQGKLENGIAVIWSAALTIIVLVVLELFKVPLSYKGAQVLEFEDDSYVYKVRMIPKMSDLKDRKGFKLFGRKKDEEDEEDLEGAYDVDDLSDMGDIARTVQGYPEDTMIAPADTIFSPDAAEQPQGMDLSMAGDKVVEGYYQTPTAEEISAMGNMGEVPAEMPAVMNAPTMMSAPTMMADPMGDTLNSQTAKRSVIADDDEPTDLFSEIDGQ